jgi:hypothetical protein
MFSPQNVLAYVLPAAIILLATPMTPGASASEPLVWLQNLKDTIVSRHHVFRESSLRLVHDCGRHSRTLLQPASWLVRRRLTPTGAHVIDDDGDSRRAVAAQPGGVGSFSLAPVSLAIGGRALSPPPLGDPTGPVLG